MRSQALRRTGAILIAAAVGTFGLSCGDDETSHGLNPLAVIAVASDVSLITVLGLQAHTAGRMTLPPFQAPGSAATPAPTVIACPAITAGGDSLLQLDFGAGCVSDFDSTFGSGLLSFDTNPDPVLNTYNLSSQIDGYSRDGRLVSGELELGDTGVNLVTLTASLVTFSGGGLGGLLSGFLSTTEDMGQSVDYCTVWIASEQSTGAMSIGDDLYGFTITAPLTFSTCCAYPTQGEMTVENSGRSATIDFGDGTCDNQAVMTVGGESQTIVLGIAP